VLTLEGGDASLGAGAPLDELDEVLACFDAAPGYPWLALAQDGDGLHAECLELRVHRRLAIATIGGDGVGNRAGGDDDPLTRVTKGPGSRAAGLAMAFKLIESAQDRWRAVNGPHLVALVRAGARFEKGVIVEREPQDQEAVA
jgi:hypothetical protein